jgi:hypothetical protein
MRRREFITLVGGVTLAWPLASQAQQPRNIPRLCFLTFDPGTLRSTRFEAFFEALGDLGYVDGTPCGRRPIRAGSAAGFMVV